MNAITKWNSLIKKEVRDEPVKIDKELLIKKGVIRY